MEILVGKNAGFCFGVQNAVLKTKKELEYQHTISCLGELVHNENVLESLENKGLKTIEKLPEKNETVIIRAHGVGKDIYEESKKRNISLIDLTCPKVSKIHQIVEDYSKNGYYVLYIGISKHPETIGTITFANQISLIENIEDINEAICEIKDRNIKDVLIIVQTTFSLEMFQTISSIIQNELKDICNIKIINSICPATKVREEETEELSKQVDFMIIIGGKNSSNTKKLYNISKEHTKTMLIQNANELDLKEIREYEKIGIMAGTSTPKENIEDVVNLIKYL